jgi:hypothetical protein
MQKVNGETSAGKNAFFSYVELTKMQEISPKIRSKFFLITYGPDENREDAFVQFILNNVEFYALTKEERERIVYARERIKTAYRRYVRYSKTGEFGEMVLFFILETFENACQIVNKMALKTAGRKHVHGADCVHFAIDDGMKVLYLGESKTTESTFDIALSRSLTSVKEYYDEKKDIFEIDLISGNLLKEISPELEAVIRDFINPDKPGKMDCYQVNAIFLGFEESFLLEYEKNNSGVSVYSKVVEEYKEKIAEYVKIIERKVTNSDISNRRFIFFLLPFKNLKKARETFTQEVTNA